MPLLISVSGIRGVVGNGLTAEVVLRAAQAYGTWLGGGKVIVGRDSRVTGEMVRAAVVAGLTAVGCDVVDVGICPTPTVQLATERQGQGGIVITASHNPIEWNALKLLAPDGLFLDEKQGQEVVSRMEKGDFRFAPWDKVGSIQHYAGAVEDHIRRILSLRFVNVAAIRKRRFRIVADCVHGAGGVIIPRLLDRLGCEYEILHEEPNGRFPRPPEPLPENLTELCDAVVKSDADLGFAVDPDVDRLALVAADGTPLGEEYTLALVADLVLSHRPGTVVVNASTSRVMEAVARRYKSRVVRTKVGEIHVAKKARQVKATLAGEGNGGVILPDAHFGRDAPVGIALVLQGLVEREMSLHDWFRSLPQFCMVKRRLELADVSPAVLLGKYQEAMSGQRLDLTDGVTVLWEDSWVQVRASNTEPIVRVLAEAPARERAEELAEEHIRLLRTLAGG
jgi:phosphomannomutase